MIYILLGLVAGALVEGVVCVVLLRKAQYKLQDTQEWVSLYKSYYDAEKESHEETKKRLLLVTESKDRIRALAQDAIDLGMATADELHESNRRLADAENLIDDLTLETIN